MKQDAYLLWGNHRSAAGIGEIVFTVAACLADRYILRPTKTIRPGKLNIIIDEFTNPYFVKQLVDIKKTDPTTKYVIVATEFITPVRIFGIEIARTFNFFWGAKDWLKLIHDLLLQGTDRLPSYMRQRYLGFIKALSVCDVLVFVHPSIGRELADAAKAYPNLVSPPVVVYPELMLALVTQDDRLERLPIGFNLTGTLTPYRRRVMAKLARQFRRAGWGRTIWRHISFAESGVVEFTNFTIKFHYEAESKRDVPFNTGSSQQSGEPTSSPIRRTRAALIRNLIGVTTTHYGQDPHGAQGECDYLFNISPPQQSGWPFSSPMRSLRAALLGQIPVVTKRFHDHEMEDIAILWDGKIDTALKMAHMAMDRKQFVHDYIQSVHRYNTIAKSKNQAFLQALELLQQCTSSTARHTRDAVPPSQLG